MKANSGIQSKTRAFFVVVLILLFLQAIRPWLRAGEAGDQCQAPYFKVLTADSSTEAFPLRGTTVKAAIDGLIARVEVAQEYANTGGKTIDALYVFPASTRAAVHGMTMEIGGRTIEARIAEKEQAKTEFEQAKKEGKTASLLEEQRPNVFQMTVGHILPGDTVRVRFVYTEVIVPEDGTYSFVFPTVVGPRYQSARHGDGAASPWVSSPFLKPGEASPTTFSFDLAIRAGTPLRDVACPTHEVKVDFPKPEEAVVSMPASPVGEAADRDIVVNYRLAGETITTGLLLDQNEKGNHFLLTLDPPLRIVPQSIPPRDYVFIVDVSGSMSGFPLDTAKTLMRELLGSLRPTDRFNLILFSGANERLDAGFLNVTPDNIDKGIRFLEQRRGGGGTELLPALDQALALPGDENRSRTLVAVTDGFIAEEPAAFERVRAQLGQANFFAFGIGGSVNRHLIEGLAAAGRGQPEIVTKPEEAAEKVRRFREHIASPLLTDVKVEFEGFQASEVEPVAIPDLFAARPLVIHGHWAGEAKGRIHVRGHSGDGDLHAVIDVEKAAALGASHPALPVLWARERVRNLLDFSGPAEKEKLRPALTELGLRYALLTPYTSFVAVDTVARPTNEPSAQVPQPSPLPQNVSVSAVGGGSVPEPGAAALTLVTLALLVSARRRSRGRAP